MRKISWHVALKDGELAILEDSSGFPMNQVESHLLIIGILQDIIKKHQEKISTLFEKTEFKKADDYDKGE